VVFDRTDHLAYANLFHVKKGDVSRWFRDVIKAPELALPWMPGLEKRDTVVHSETICRTLPAGSAVY